MASYLDNRDGYRGFTVNRNAGTFTAPFNMGDNRIPLDPNQTVYTKGRSALDNMYGTSTDPRIKATPPSVFRTNNAIERGLFNNRSFSALPSNVKNTNRPNTYIDPNKRVPNNLTPSDRQPPISTANNRTAKTKPNFKNSLLNYLDSSQGRGMARGLLEASGYSDTPVSFGQALAQGMARSDEAVAADRANELAKLKMEIERSKIKPQETFTQQMIEVADGKGGTTTVPVNVSNLTGKVTPVMSSSGININTGQGTGGWKKVNEKFGTEVNEWVLSGGFTGAQANLIKIDDAIQQLEKSKDDFFGLTGKNVGVMPKGLRAFFNPDSADLEDNIRSIVYESLRQTLGAQFAEREGEKLIQASFNSMLSEEKNIVRLKRMRAKILEMAKAKQKAYEYFQDNDGDMSGYSGSTLVFDNENQMTAGADDVLNSIYTADDYTDFSDKEFTDYFKNATEDEQAWILQNAKDIPQIKIGEEE